LLKRELNFQQVRIYLLPLAMKEFWKWVQIWWSYCREVFLLKHHEIVMTSHLACWQWRCTSFSCNYPTTDCEIIGRGI